jgi:hypothetical protein
MWCAYSLFAIGAVKIIKDYTWTIILVLYLTLETAKMEDVTTGKVDAWFLAKAWAETNTAIFVLVLFRSHCWVHLGNTLLLKTWHTLLFSSASATWMSTRQQLVTTLLHKVEAFWISADVPKSRFHTWRWLLELSLTEAADFGIVLVTSFTCMIWLIVTACTEVFLTLITPYSIVCHMYSCLFGNGVTLVIFLSFNDFTRDELHNVAALTANEIWI